MTPNTIVTTPALLAELKKVREQGYAVDDQEHELEGRCLGAPIVDSHGNVLAALSISSPVFRMDRARVERLAVTLRKTCAAISRSIHI
jgi:DNA-binding IclR family transcriptional regulator